MRNSFNGSGALLYQTDEECVASMTTGSKAVLIFDGKCGFCRIWIDYWRRLIGDEIEYASSQEARSEYPQIPPEDFKRSVQLALPTGEVISGARAVFMTLSYAPSRRWLMWAYESLPGVELMTESAYRWISAHRDFGYRITVLLFGRSVRPLEFRSVEWLFRKLLAVIWIIAFVSFGSQAQALIGSHGILPASQYLQRASAFLGAKAWLSVPTVFWWGHSDMAIQLVWVAGALCGVMAFFGVLWRASLLLAFVLYLSVVNVSQEFLSYQWDILLLETGLLAIFTGYSKVVIWLFRWLLFRLMFLSGAVKLLSGDPTWKSLTALRVHFETQPIPTPLAWYVHQAPEWFLKLGCGLVFVIELAVPLLIFMPRRPRQLAAVCLIGLQVLILATGNYAFFNWLSIGLCLFLLDDALLGRLLPMPWMEWATKPDRVVVPHRVRRLVTGALAVVLGVLSLSLFTQTLTGKMPTISSAIVSFAAPFNLTSSYGLFATMTTERYEIVLEGSGDGTNWREYEFPYKAGALDRSPPWVAPHQPRIDWQMWFASLGTYQENIWFLNMVARLLQGAPEVSRQLQVNPFPSHPPTWMRAELYQYHFTRWGSEGWWTRTPVRQYLPPVSLDALSELPILRNEASHPDVDQGGSSVD